MPNPFQTEVAQWAGETFPGSTIGAKVAHLKKEFAEFLEAVEAGDLAHASEEMADCYLIFLHTAESMAFSLEDAARVKLAINRTRRWGKPDAGGCVEHIREGEG